MENLKIPRKPCSLFKSSCDLWPPPLPVRSPAPFPRSVECHLKWPVSIFLRYNTVKDTKWSPMSLRTANKSLWHSTFKSFPINRDRLWNFRAKTVQWKEQKNMSGDETTATYPSNVLKHKDQKSGTLQIHKILRNFRKLKRLWEDDFFYSYSWYKQNDNCMSPL